MNGKLAKAMRYATRFIPSDERTYQDKAVKTVMVDTGRIDAEGNAIIMPQVRIVRTVVGVRTDYQDLKKFHYANRA